MVGKIMLIIIMGLAFLAPLPSHAQPQGPGPGWYEGMPYGRSCPGRQWGPYGARKAIKNTEEAKAAVEKYYAGSSRTVQVTITDERRHFYIAEVADTEGNQVDKLIVDKRTGRIRSVY